MPLPKYCQRCNKRYQPVGRRQKLCEDCWSKAQRVGMRRYNKRMEVERNDILPHHK